MVDVECCGNGTLNAAEDACVCDSGYNDDAGPLLCGPDTPDPWPPTDFETLWNADHDPAAVACIMPACDECGGYPGDFDPSGTWTRTLTTLTSTCDEALYGIDPRTEPGNVAVEPGETLGNPIGNCSFAETDDDPPQRVHVGTFYENTGVSCGINPQLLGASVEIGYVTYSGDSGTGVSTTHIIGLAPLFEDCMLELEVVYERE